jgi:hypothetical protein
MPPLLVAGAVADALLLINVALCVGLALDHLAPHRHGEEWPIAAPAAKEVQRYGRIEEGGHPGRIGTHLGRAQQGQYGVLDGRLVIRQSPAWPGGTHTGAKPLMERPQSRPSLKHPGRYRGGASQAIYIRP